MSTDRTPSSEAADRAGDEAVRPPALRPGDTVLLVSPSGPTRPERVARGVELLTGWGLRPVPAPNAYARQGYLAGADALRAADLNAAFADPAIRGVICTRGGYGAQRIVDAIDMAAVRRDPKVVAGFSDITALQLALWRGARLASVHGPGAAWLDERTPLRSAESLHAALTSTAPVTLTADPAAETGPVRVPGRATGTLLGGNLCLLAASVGTPDLPDLTGAILLVEEVQEPPYKVDRMLTHLRRAGALAGVAGVAVGQFTGCADGWATTVADVLTERLGDLGVPVLGGFPVGHGEGQLTVPVGTTATLDTATGTLTVAAAVR
ncbi:S66 peptidase family protein [Micromonospora yangpuensis]|uniref:Muramoyltetrapeptide carboxypeptidase n=1 Tax=Micromonospora yangpuensis TaxID=683228 RepID=A0A1C6V191_9ACTN|nr:LD-carboxypeptidase [Micromonospora yangpuensis]GGL97548.1 peptidase S66 [Micromonospora yangpuensis]SCL60078.1 muramoyltetrapeptide carboxypeptidase [Micromonospora yangpuensis]